MVGVPRVARRRPRQVEARAADREFVRRQLAQHDRAGAAQPRDADRVGGRDIVDQDLGMAGRRQAGDIDDVLDADRHAVQRAARPARHDLGLGGPGRVHRRLGVEPDEDMQLRVEPLDALQQRRRQLDRRQLAGGDRPRRRRPRVSQCRSLTARSPPASAATVRRADRSAPSSCATEPLACSAAAATSSGNSASALSSPARRASNSIVALSIRPPAPSIPGTAGMLPRRRAMTNGHFSPARSMRVLRREFFSRRRMQADSRERSHRSPLPSRPFGYSRAVHNPT